MDVVIGQNIKNIRSQRGISQSALGEKLDITFQQIQKYEKASNRVAAATLVEMANAFGVPVETFYQGVEDLPTGEIQTPLAPALSSRAYRLAVLFDANRNTAFKKAVFDLLEAADNGLDTDDVSE